MKIKRLTLIAIAIFAVATMVNAGAPPTVMFLPDKTWCNANGYVTKTEANGKTRINEDYDAAFLNEELTNLIVQLNGLIKDKGLVPKDYITTTDLDDEAEMEEEAYGDDTQSGGSMDATTYEVLMSKLRPDIVIRVGWNKNSEGFNYGCTYRLEAVDSYSGKSIANTVGTTGTQKSITPVGVAIMTSATESMGTFLRRLMEHFEDIQTNGREITVSCRIGNNGSGINFNSEFGDKELSEIISDWMNDNTVNHNYSTRTSSRNRIDFEQVRIPFKDANGRVMQAKEFVDQLKKYLRKNYQLKSENTTKGLGSGRLYDICQ